VAHRVILLVDDDARFAKLTKAFLLIGDTNEVLVARDGGGGHRIPLPSRARPFGNTVPGAHGPQHASPRRLRGAQEDARSGAQGCTAC
jgi:hypothetical protein